MNATTPFFCFGAGLLALALVDIDGHSLIVEKTDRPFGEGQRSTFIKQMPPETFKSREGVEEWAETSSLGGGRIEGLDGREGQAVLFAFRTFTSGVPSSDLSVYIEHETGEWQLVLHRQPVLRDFIDVIRKDDRFVFKSRNAKKILLELPFDGLDPVTTFAGMREVDLLSMFKPEFK